MIYIYIYTYIIYIYISYIYTYNPISLCKSTSCCFVFSLPSCLKLEQFLGDFPFPGGHFHAALRRDLDGKATLFWMIRTILGRDETSMNIYFFFGGGEGTLGIYANYAEWFPKFFS